MHRAEPLVLLKSSALPHLLPCSHKLKQITVGENSIIAVTVNNKLLSAGKNGFSQCGPNANQTNLLEYEFFSDKPVKHVYTHVYSSIVETLSGDLYVFGYNGAGGLT